jgi:predicted O-methyltransferase YrrM
MDLFSIRRFTKYFIFSRHRCGHGIHSPFVFDLVSNVFRNKIEPDIVCSIEKIRKKLIADQGLINIYDLGAGSKKMKSNQRKVSDIARYSAVPRKYGILLSKMSKVFGNPLVLEFGTSLGISTMYLAASCPETTVVTMEGCKETSEVAAQNFEEAGLKNIRLLNGTFDELLPRIKNEKICPGLVFIDGNHKKEPVIRYFNQIAGMSDNSTVVIIDDIYSSQEMEQAWSEIKNHGDVSISIDIFRMGIVFFMKGLNRSSYVIRY